MAVKQQKTKEYYLYQPFLLSFCKLNKDTGIMIFLIILSQLSLILNRGIFIMNKPEQKNGVDDCERSG
jgi:hypothetical protein